MTNSTFNNVAFFANVWDSFPTATFNSQWPNGTGYFDGAVTDGSIKTVVTFVDPKGRRGIIIPGDRGNLVVFQRYSPGNGPDVLVYNAPAWWDGPTSGKVGGDGNPDFDEMIDLMGVIL